MSDWNSGAPAPPSSLEQWLNVITRQLSELESAPSGFGRRAWTDAVMPPGFVEEYPFLPGFRWTQDGRVEVRGRVKKADGSAIANNDVVLRLPYECAPPNNKPGPTGEPSIISSVSVIGLATVGSNSSGVCRFDIQRELAWLEEPVLDWEGNPMYYEDGEPMIRPLSEVEVIARTPVPISGWIGFDNVVYDPRLYLDVLPPVPPPQDPLVPRPGRAVMQHGDGSTQGIVPGVKYT